MKLIGREIQQVSFGMQTNILMNLDSAKKLRKVSINIQVSLDQMFGGGGLPI